MGSGGILHIKHLSEKILEFLFIIYGKCKGKEKWNLTRTQNYSFYLFKIRHDSPFHYDYHCFWCDGCWLISYEDLFLTFIYIHIVCKLIVIYLTEAGALHEAGYDYLVLYLELLVPLPVWTFHICPFHYLGSYCTWIFDLIRNWYIYKTCITFFVNIRFPHEINLIKYERKFSISLVAIFKPYNNDQKFINQIWYKHFCFQQ